VIGNFPPRRFDPRFGLVQGSHATVVQGQEGYSIQRTNSLGWYDDEVAAAPAGPRAVLLGDSYSVGLQVRAEDNFSKVAERRLPGLEIINTAQAGRSPVHHAGYAGVLVSEFRPALLIIQVSDGDVRDIREPAGLRAALREVSGQDPRLLGSRGLSNERPDPILALLRESSLLKFCAMRSGLLLKAERDRFRRKFHGAGTRRRSEILNDVDARTEVVMDSLFGEIARHSPRTVLLYIPNLNYFAGGGRVEGPANRRLFAGLATRHGFRVVDPTDAFLEEFRRTGQPCHGFSNSTIGTGHINARGHEIVGRLLAEALREELP
jgi:hypothetical protein